MPSLAPELYRPPEKGLFHLDEPQLGEPETDELPREILHGGMWPAQRSWWELPNTVKLFVGGYGSGKTLALGKRMIAGALHNAPVPCAIVSPTYPMARQTIVPTLVDILDSLKAWHTWWRGMGASDITIDYKWLKTAPIEFKITYARPGYGKRVATLLIYSGEHPDRLKGANLAQVGIDEPFIQEQAVFEQMMVRARHPRARLREVLLTGTPEQLNWGYDLAEGELADRYDVGIVTASTLENKALAQSYIDQLVAGFDPKAAQAYLHGMFVNMAEGLVLYGFDRMENVVDLERPPGAQLGAGMDFNVNPMASAVFWHTHNHIHFFDEIELPNSNTPDMCSELGERYWDEGLREVYPDASGKNRSTAAPVGKSDYSHIEAAGFSIEAPRRNPPPRDRWNAANGMLRPVGGRVRCTISPKCKKLIKYSSLYSHPLKNTEAHKKMSHLLDAATYPVARLFPIKRKRKHTRIRGV